MLADQARPSRRIVVPFFGRPAPTTTSIARLAGKTGALFCPSSACGSPGALSPRLPEPVDVDVLPAGSAGRSSPLSSRRSSRSGSGRARAVALASRSLEGLTRCEEPWPFDRGS
ncbi:MAG: hypothetical protein IPN83_00030 [Holophagales bacterium]|nr:hypothetical protein [Holophagales bacterium]